MYPKLKTKNSHFKKRGQAANLTLVACITFNNVDITSLEYVVHLGNLLGKSKTYSNINKGINDFTAKFNNIVPVFEHSHTRVKYEVFKTFVCACTGVCCGIFITRFK